jgi:hypothetical protein
MDSFTTALFLMYFVLKEWDKEWERNWQITKRKQIKSQKKKVSIQNKTN